MLSYHESTKINSIYDKIFSFIGKKEATMNYIIKLFSVAVMSTVIANAQNIKDTNLTGQKVFETYCWGCHHQTSVAFGPSFEQIASLRSEGEIKGHIIDPKSMYKQLGHKRSVMPAFDLSEQELNLITEFILSFKPTVQKGVK